MKPNFFVQPVRSRARSMRGQIDHASTALSGTVYCRTDQRFANAQSTEATVDHDVLDPRAHPGWRTDHDESQRPNNGSIRSILDNQNGIGG